MITTILNIYNIFWEQNEKTNNLQEKNKYVRRWCNAIFVLDKLENLVWNPLFREFYNQNSINTSIRFELFAYTGDKEACSRIF